MAAVGRGKGRGFAEIRNTSLRRPGRTVSLKFNEIINLIDNVEINKSIPSRTIVEIEHAIFEALKDNTLEEVFDELYKQAVEDKEFCKKLGIVFSDDKILSLGDYQFRYVILTKAQKNFDNREELRKRSIKEFRTAILFLGEIYNNTTTWRPLHILALPLVTYLEMLLEDAEEENIEIVMLQIYFNGSKIAVKHEDKLKELMLQVRTVLIQRNLSMTSRGMLVYILEMDRNRYLQLHEKVQEFYVNIMGAEVFECLKRPEKLVKAAKFKYQNPSPKAPMNPTVQPGDENSESTLIKTNVQGQNLDSATDNKSVQSAQHINNDKHSVPRAIRGKGATESSRDKNSKKSPKGRIDKATDDKILSLKPKINSNVWGHDDRFEKDYE